MVQTLREKFFSGPEFLVGAELVSVRGTMAERSAVKARAYAQQLTECPAIDWISITDNAGGNPQLAPQALAKPILYAGKEVVIHLTCKDLNRNGLESEAWLLESEGFQNILAMTGDYPAGGLAKPVFDIDSIGLISLLEKMNQGFGLEQNGAAGRRLGKTRFFIGAVTTNFKLQEGEVMPQYFKLQKKVECGAQFIINQIGFDARKMQEQRVYMDDHGMGATPLIGNVYVLNPHVAQIFHDGRIPGVVVTSELLEQCQRQASSPDRGEAFFLELAARQMAIYRGLGYRGVYLGGISDFAAVARILELERSFARDGWKQFARQMRFSRPGEFYYYDEDRATALSSRQPRTKEEARPAGAMYRLSQWAHDAMFTPGHTLHDVGKRLCQDAADPAQGPGPLRALERMSKAALYQCRDCGDCSLPEIAFLCPESQCAKNQRNGPCGGTRAGACEVDGFGDCIWLRAYERLKADGAEQDLLRHVPMTQNQGLRGASAWANFWLGRDHTARDSQT
ncbi:MAG TPA: methylenetetrahydrofolate reductase C-terminal domain-containing protein [Verrucomicrobiae bacterium]|jgi:methylenetetrahydrofolate reductase (NADPH)|nr:methylenetetrahydrofolate reductase C-terminal domain-containing protein [Verrucomicrobiae bacterium]